MKITKKLIITNTLWSAVAQVGVMAINLLVLPLFIKNLGVELYGIWVISNVVLGYLNVFDFGFTQGLQKYVAEARVKGDDKELSEVVVSGVGLLLVIGLLLGGVFWFGAPSIVEFFNIQPENQLIASQLLKISALFCVVMWPLRIVDVVLNASMKIKELSFLIAFTTGAQSVVMLGMVYYAADIVLIKWVTTGLMAICSACGLVLLRKYVPEINWSPLYFKLSQLRRMHKFSLGMFYAAVILMFQSQLDTLIIARYVSASAVAGYVIQAKLLQLVQRFSGIFSSVLTPASYSLSAQKDSRRLQELIEKSVYIRTVITTFIGAFAFSISPYFLDIWVGSEYSSGTQWSRYYLLICPFIGLANISQIAKAVGHIKLVNVFVSIEMITNLILSLLLVRWLGVGGPILGTVISFYLLGPPIFLLMLGRVMPEVSVGRIYSSILPILGAAVLSVLIFLNLAVRVESKWATLVLNSTVSASLLILSIGVTCLWRFIRQKDSSPLGNKWRGIRELFLKLRDLL